MQAEEVFRSANERIAEKASELGWRFPVPFLCECSDSHCFRRIELTLEEYNETRSHPQRYLTAPGHEILDGFVLEQDDRVAFAEKLLIGT